MTGDDEKSRTEILLRMHEFYAQEARNQRAMMWETVKWFTVILGATVAFWIGQFKAVFEKYDLHLLIICIFTAFGGCLLSLICMSLLRWLYTLSLKMINTFAKIEEELDFNTRKRKTYFKGDDYITDMDFLDNRATFYKSEQLISKLLSVSLFKAVISKKNISMTMYHRMVSVFYLFFALFLFASIFSVCALIWKIIHG